MKYKLIVTNDVNKDYNNKKSNIFKKHQGGVTQNNCIEPITIVKAPERLIAIGDIHGDLDLMINLLEISELIKQVKTSDNYTVTLKYKDNSTRYYKWIGNKTVVVQVGDQVDRCRPFMDSLCTDPGTTYEDEASDEKILKFFTDLHNVAIKYGGAVYSLLGNHELRNAMGIYDYVSYLGLKEYTPQGENVDDRWRASHFMRGKRLSQFMACSRSSIIIVGSYMFVHAGFLESLIHEIYNFKSFNHHINKKINKETMLQYLNKLVNMWLYNPSFESSDVNNLISGLNSPFLIRDLGNLPPDLPIDHEYCSDISYVLDYFKIKGMVIGHTPQLTDGINTTCGKSIYRIDVASSKAFDNIIDKNDSLYKKTREPQVLEILNDCTINVISKTRPIYTLKKCN